MRILAVDPGKMTGLALTSEMSLVRWELPYLEALDAAGALIMAQAINVVVCENYIVGQGTIRKAQGENWSLKSIGALEWMCHYATGIEFILQKPADAKTFSTDEKLRELGWWLPGHPHANDSLRHLLLFLAREGHWDVAQSLRP